MRTCSLGLTLDESQSCNSLWSVVTSSTELFLSATRKTLLSSLFACSRDRRPMERVSSASDSTITSCTPFDTALGVVQPLLNGVWSMRMIRIPSEVNTSRQKGQHGVARGFVFSRTFLQQFRQRTCPVRGVDRISKSISFRVIYEMLTTRDRMRIVVRTVLLSAHVAERSGAKGNHKEGPFGMCCN